MVEIVKRAWNLQGQIEERARHLGKGRYGRVLKMARKPTAKEYSKVLQITSLGLIILGAAGFGIYLFIAYVPGWLKGLLG